MTRPVSPAYPADDRAGWHGPEGFASGTGFSVVPHQPEISVEVGARDSLHDLTIWSAWIAGEHDLSRPWQEATVRPSVYDHEVARVQRWSHALAGDLVAEEPAAGEGQRGHGASGGKRHQHNRGSHNL